MDPAGTGFGCSDDVDGVYRFSLGGSTLLGEDCVGGSQAPGCYRPFLDEALSDFVGQPKGGCFALLAADNAGGDTGEIVRWTVYTENDGGGTPTVTTSWGAIKSRF